MGCVWFYPLRVEVWGRGGLCIFLVSMGAGLGFWVVYGGFGLFFWLVFGCFFGGFDYCWGGVVFVADGC